MARTGALNVALGSGPVSEYGTCFRRNDERLGAIYRALTGKTYPCETPSSFGARSRGGKRPSPCGVGGHRGASRNNRTAGMANYPRVKEPDMATTRDLLT